MSEQALGLVQPHDDELFDGPAAAASGGTMLDMLREELAQEVRDDIILLNVPQRPGYAVRFLAKVPYDRYAAWTKKAADKRDPSGINALQLACIVIGNTCQAIVRNGEDVVDGQGRPLTFASPDLKDILGVPDARSAIMAFYGNDGHILVTNQEIVRAAGYADAVDNVDEDAAVPTRP